MMIILASRGSLLHRAPRGGGRRNSCKTCRWRKVLSQHPTIPSQEPGSNSWIQALQSLPTITTLKVPVLSLRPSPEWKWVTNEWKSQIKSFIITTQFLVDSVQHRPVSDPVSRGWCYSIYCSIISVNADTVCQYSENFRQPQGRFIVLSIFYECLSGWNVQVPPDSSPLWYVAWWFLACHIRSDT